MTRKDQPSGITAAELAAKLAVDPEFQERASRQERELQERVDEWREAERPIVEDLRAAGVDVQSVWDLVNTDVPYPDALPVLLSHLESGAFPDRVMEGVGRALAVAPAIEFWDRLASVYRSAEGAGQAEGAAVALAACASPQQFQDLVDFLSIEERGETRIYFLRPIKDLGGLRSRTVLEALTGDEYLGAEAKVLLGRVT